MEATTGAKDSVPGGAITARSARSAMAMVLAAIGACTHSGGCWEMLEGIFVVELVGDVTVGSSVVLVAVDVRRRALEDVSSGKMKVMSRTMD